MKVITKTHHLTIGTAHFTSLYAAYIYYAVYGYNKKDVDGKVQRGEIVISRPNLPGEITIKDGRYFQTI